MSFPKYNQTNSQERLGVNAVAEAMAKIGQIWRETPMADVGIDGQIEYVSPEGFPVAMEDCVYKTFLASKLAAVLGVKSPTANSPQFLLPITQERCSQQLIDANVTPAQWCYQWFR